MMPDLGVVRLLNLMRHKLLLFWLLLSICLTPPALAFEAGDAVYRILSDNTCELQGINYSNTDVKIPSTVSYNGKTYTVVSIGEKAFQKDTHLQRITLPNTLQSIGAEAFKGCTDLRNFTLPDGLQTIGASAFSGCTHVSEVIIPNTVYSIGESAFSFCSVLTTIVFPDNRIDRPQFIPKSVCSGCSMLVNVIIPDTYTDIRDNAFNQCTSLKTISLPAGLTSLGLSAFSDCKSLESILLPNSIEFIDSYAFANCEKLTNISIPDKVTVLGHSCFSGCKNLRTVEIGSSVKAINKWTFLSCDALSNVTIKDSDTPLTMELGSETSIEIGMFANCPIKTLYIGRDLNYDYGNDAYPFYCEIRTNVLKKVTIGEKVHSINKGMFYGCNLLENIALSENITDIGDRAFMNCVKLETVLGGNNLEAIGSYAFSNCPKLTVLETAPKVTLLGSHAFDGCTNLESIGTLNMKTVPNSTFENCEHLMSVELGENVNVIGSRAFFNCKNISSLVIPSNVTTIEDDAFNGCNSITSLTLNDSPNPIKLGICIKDYTGPLASPGTFAHCCLQTLYMGRDYTYGSREYTSINGPFSNQESLKSVEVGANVRIIPPYFLSGSVNLENFICRSTIMSEIGDFAFVNCVKLPYIDIPNSVTKIGQGAFGNCRIIKALQLPEGLEYLGAEAFANCSSLESMVIPNKVPSLQAKLFLNCSKLKDLIIADGNAPIEISYNSDRYGKYNFLSNTCITELRLGRRIIWLDETDRNLKTFSNLATLKSVYVGKDITDIDSHMFGNCVNLTDVILHDDITSIGDSTFVNCPLSPEFHLPQNITNIGVSAFENSTGIVDLNLTNKMTFGEEAYKGCRSLRSVILDVEEIPLGLFNGCENLVDVQIKSNVKKIMQYSFRNCTSLTSITIPSNISYISQDAFYGCTNIKEAFLEDGINRLRTDEYSDSPLFGQSQKLEKLYIGRDISASFAKSTENITFGDYVNYPCSFVGMANLRNITWGKSIKKIGSFSGCASLKNITIPPKVKDLIDVSFDGCSSLKTLRFEDSSDSLLIYGNNVLATTPIDTVYMGRNLVNGGRDNSFVNIFNIEDEHRKLKAFQIGSLVNQIDGNLLICVSVDTLQCFTENPPKIKLTENSDRYLYTKSLCSEFKLWVPEEYLRAYSSADIWKNFSIFDVKSISLPNDIKIGVRTKKKFKIETEPRITRDESYTATSMDNSIASVNVFGDSIEISGNKAGNVVIEVEGKFSHKTTSTKVEILPASISGITISCPKTDLYVGESVQDNATVLPVDTPNKDIVWTSSDASVVKVDNNGFILAISKGKSIVRATSADASIYDEIEINVHSVPVQSIKIDEGMSNKTYCVGDVFYISAKVYPENATNKDIVWSFDWDRTIEILENDLDACTIKCRAISGGPVKIIATSSENPTISDEIDLNIAPLHIVVEIEDNISQIIVGESVRANAVKRGHPVYQNESGITWESDNPEIATVDQNGIITGVSAGVAYIYAKSKGYSDGFVIISVVSGEPTVQPSKMWFDQSYVFITTDGTYRILPKFDVNYSDFYDRITWQCSDNRVLTIDQNGYIKGLKRGVVDITATIPGGLSASFEAMVIVSGITPVLTVGDIAYQMNVPQRTATVVQRIGQNGLNYDNVSDLSIPGTVELRNYDLSCTVSEISESAFSNSSISLIELPNTIQKIGDKAFKNMSSLKVIHVNMTNPIKVAKSSFDDEAYQKTTLVVPQLSIDKYKSAETWKLFLNITDNPNAGIYDFESDRIEIYRTLDGIAFKNVSDDDIVDIYGLSGMRIYRGVPNPIALQRGTYVIVINGKPKKYVIN